MVAAHGDVDVLRRLKAAAGCRHHLLDSAAHRQDGRLQGAHRTSPGFQVLEAGATTPLQKRTAGHLLASPDNASETMIVAISLLTGQHSGATGLQCVSTPAPVSG